MGVDIHKVTGKIPFKSKRGFFYRSTAIPDPTIPCVYNCIPKIAHCPGRSRTMQSMQSLCVKISDIEITRTEKADCDRKMLAELNALTPRGGREKRDRQLVRCIIGLEKTGNGCALEQSTSRLTAQTGEEALSKTQRVCQTGR